MKPLPRTIFILATLTSANTFAETKTPQPLPDDFDNCNYGLNLIHEVTPIVNKVVSMANEKASYKDIAQWRANSVNSEIERLKAKYSLPPMAFTNYKYNTAKIAYNDVLYRTGSLVQGVYADARNNYTNYDNSKPQYKIFKEGKRQVIEACTLPEDSPTPK